MTILNIFGYAGRQKNAILSWNICTNFEFATFLLKTKDIFFWRVPVFRVLLLTEIPSLSFIHPSPNPKQITNSSWFFFAPPSRYLTLNREGVPYWSSPDQKHTQNQMYRLVVWLDVSPSPSALSCKRVTDHELLSTKGKSMRLPTRHAIVWTNKYTGCTRIHETPYLPVTCTRQVMSRCGPTFPRVNMTRH